MKGAPRSGGGFANQSQSQPDGTIRRSQVVTTFGPGATVDLLNDAVLVGGLDFWSYDKTKTIPHVDEPRLRDAIVDRFRKQKRELSVEHPFRAAPGGNDREPSKFNGVQVLEFPQWYVCQNARCRALMRKEGLELTSHKYWHQCERTKKTECVPVRFVAACRRGHIDEFGWIHFVHSMSERERCAAPALEFHEGPTGDFNDIVITCACGARAKLNATNGAKLPCFGARPWLGPEGKEECADTIKVLVRTASNAYFPMVVSALSIPNPGDELHGAIMSVIDLVKTATPQTLPAFRTIPKVGSALEGHKDEEVLAVVKAIVEEKPVTQGHIRTAEFRQLSESEPEMKGDLPRAGVPFFARVVKPKGGLPKGVARLVVASKLREVAAQIGFTRLEPVSPDLQGEYDLGVEAAPLGLATNWLPATEMRGEGVFLQLDEKAVAAWENRDAVMKRGKELVAGYDAWARGVDSAPPFPGVRYYMLHALSHLLMQAISLECGYAASAIRERIYCGPSASDPTPMAAILLTTGTSGTEGTLGGLVEQGRQIRAHLQHAWDLGKLCSNDPVCGTHSPFGDHAERFLEGAACHGCLFVAECSCERFNRYLDRALVVPTMSHEAEVAFFDKRP
jgi:hypothetical protein